MFLLAEVDFVIFDSNDVMTIPSQRIRLRQRLEYYERYSTSTPPLVSIDNR